MVLEKTLETPLDCKEIQPVHSEGDQSRVFFGRNDAKAETPVLWPPHAKSWLIGKDSDARRGWGQEEKGTTEDEMVGWHHQLDGHEFEQAPGVYTHFVFCSVYMCSVAQSYLILSDPMDCSPPGLSVHGTFQARILKWVAISYSRERFHKHSH